MIINNYAKKWCEEDYDLKKEDFYVENAYYIASRQWAKGALKCCWIPVLVFFFSVIIDLSLKMSIGKSFLDSLVNSGFFTLAFWFYGIRKYDANDSMSAKGIYPVLLLFLFITKSKIPFAILAVGAIAVFALYIYLTIYNPIVYFKNAKKVKARIIEEENESDASEKESYDHWKEKYKAYRFGIPETNIPESDDEDAKARHLFDGYCNTLQALKTRYRQLLKQYHPDVGGDSDFCQRIIKVYEEYRAKLS